MFRIEDESHAEPQKGEFNSYEEALKELKNRSMIPWNEKPNKCPCTSWKTCERNNEIIEYDDANIPWKEVSRRLILNTSAKGATWIK